MELVEENPMTPSDSQLGVRQPAFLPFQLQAQVHHQSHSPPSKTGSNAGWMYTLDPVQCSHTSLYITSPTQNTSSICSCTIKVVANMLKSVYMKRQSLKIK